jgi:hypothetical protein
MNHNLAQTSFTVLCLLSSFAYAQDSDHTHTITGVIINILSVAAGGTQFLTLAPAVTEQGII